MSILFYLKKDLYHLLVKGYELTNKRILEDDHDKGFESIKERKLDEGTKKIQFTDLKDKPLGSVPSILFWNNQQIEFITNIKNMKHTLLMGDYGTGQI